MLGLRPVAAKSLPYFCTMYDVVNFTRLQISEAHINGAPEQVEEKVVITVNCSLT